MPNNTHFLSKSIKDQDGMSQRRTRQHFLSLLHKVHKVWHPTESPLACWSMPSWFHVCWWSTVDCACHCVEMFSNATPTEPSWFKSDNMHVLSHHLFYWHALIKNSANPIDKWTQCLAQSVCIMKSVCTHLKMKLERFKQRWEFHVHSWCFTSMLKDVLIIN